jgi:2-dehydro-3-deoxyphosphooctonate aldolase (KDO 8-P synthase)
MTENKGVRGLDFFIPGLKPHDKGGFLLIAGPCVVESRELIFEIAETIVKLAERFRLPLVFKSSYRKANRSRLDSFTGIGDVKALRILKDAGDHFGVPVITDVHSPEEAVMAAAYVDVLQVPAFLSRQTDLLVACAETGKSVSIKKGQFLAPSAMRFAADKVLESGNGKILITERGTTFGYGDLVVDFRGIPEMQKLGYPVVLDVTHSLQQPNRASGVTGGTPEMIEYMARAGIAVGADGIFLETHPRPEEAKSDGLNMLPLSRLEALLQVLVRLREVVVDL